MANYECFKTILEKKSDSLRLIYLLQLWDRKWLRDNYRFYFDEVVISKNKFIVEFSFKYTSPDNIFNLFKRFSRIYKSLFRVVFFSESYSNSEDTVFFLDGKMHRDLRKIANDPVNPFEIPIELLERDYSVHKPKKMIYGINIDPKSNLPIKEKK